MPSPPLKTFICYAREDRPALENLMGHLAVFERNGAVQFWYDREITGGKDWDGEIRANLKSADIVLLLISPDFFRSDYIHSVELTEALERDRSGEALVVPLILKKCLWQKHPELARLQALPAEARPVFDRNHWPEPDDGFFDIAEGFDRILDDPGTEARRQRREAADLEKSLGLEMVRVQGGSGSFHLVGIHPVTLPDFAIGKYPVTQKIWKEIMGSNPSHFKGDDRPVENVSWEEVQDFLKKLNTRFSGKNYRLPSEAEWEFAARGGTLSKGFEYAGSNQLDEVGWYLENSGNQTQPVGRKKANELGLYDMSGNVGEWCEDDWHHSLDVLPVDGSAWLGHPNRGIHVYRGGFWCGLADGCRVSHRNHHGPGYRGNHLGFRLASSPQ